MQHTQIPELFRKDPSVEFQARRDLAGEVVPELQARTETEGWGAAYLAARNPDGSWGRSFYQPKWTSSHYTLLDLCSLEIPRTNEAATSSVAKILAENKGRDGGIDPNRKAAHSDVCINGMFLNYGCYFGAPQDDLGSVVDFLLAQRMSDGGFNCQSNRSGARHSSMHSTLSVLEGILRYREAGHGYRLAELAEAEESSREFLLMHRLFRSDHSGEIIHQSFLKPVFPARWKYNIYRALDYFRAARVPYDERMAEALDLVRAGRGTSGWWTARAGHPGQVHFVLEPPRQPSAWLTLIAMRVLAAYEAIA